MVVGQRYRLESAVGRGGYGVVYRAQDLHTGQPVAVKILSPAASRDAQTVERMVREQQAMSALAGTNAVAALDLCRADSGALCLVMEWLDGVDLEQRLAGLQQQGSQMSKVELLTIVAPVAETLEKARELGIVHRDLKPANIFLMAAPRGGVRLLDFGLSRMKSSATITAFGMVMGSPSYIAPETWRGDSRIVDHRADLYSLGVITFRALGGQVPFEAESLAKLLMVVTNAPRPSLCRLRPDLPPSVDLWVQRALAISPEQRFQTASEYYHALRAVLRGEPLPQPQCVAPPNPDRETGIAAAWSMAASMLKRFAAQLGLPLEGLGDEVPTTAKTAPAAHVPQPPVPVRAHLPPVPWPRSPAQTGQGSRAARAERVLSGEPAATPVGSVFEPAPPQAVESAPTSSEVEAESGDRPSLVSEMLPTTDLRVGSDSSEDVAAWLGELQPPPEAAVRTASPTITGFRARLAYVLADADSQEPAASAGESGSESPETPVATAQAEPGEAAEHAADGKSDSAAVEMAPPSRHHPEPSHDTPAGTAPKRKKGKRKRGRRKRQRAAASESSPATGGADQKRSRTGGDAADGTGSSGTRRKRTAASKAAAGEREPADRTAASGRRSRKRRRKDAPGSG